MVGPSNEKKVIELCRQIHERVLAKLDVKAEKEDVEKLEERVRTNEKTLVKHKTIGSIVGTGVAALLTVFR